MKVKNLTPQWLNKWIAEDITEPDMSYELFSVLYYVENSDKSHSVFYFLESEKPPTVGFSRSILENVETDYIELKRPNRWHPLNHVSKSGLVHGMMRSIFELDADAVE